MKGICNMLRTVGDLRRELKDLPDNFPLWGGMFGGKNSIKAVVVDGGEAFIVPAGLGDVFDLDPTVEHSVNITFGS